MNRLEQIEAAKALREHGRELTQTDLMCGQLIWLGHPNRRGAPTGSRVSFAPMSTTEEERDVAGVTPPGMDTPEMREWIGDQARERGWKELEWVHAIDSNGLPYQRLLGRRPS